MKTPTRIYLIDFGGEKHLVRAPSQAAALMHVARALATVCVASQDDLVDCLTAGVAVETAGAAAANAPERGERTADLFAATPSPEPEHPSPWWTDPIHADVPTDDAGDQSGEAGPLGGAAEPIDAAQAAQVTQVAAVMARHLASPRSPKAAPVRYRCPDTGQTWSGRGLKPAWLRAALEQDRSLSEFLVLPGQQAGGQTGVQQGGAA